MVRASLILKSEDSRSALWKCAQDSLLTAMGLRRSLDIQGNGGQCFSLSTETGVYNVTGPAGYRDPWTFDFSLDHGSWTQLEFHRAGA